MTVQSESHVLIIQHGRKHHSRYALVPLSAWNAEQVDKVLQHKGDEPSVFVAGLIASPEYSCVSLSYWENVDGRPGYLWSIFHRYVTLSQPQYQDVSRVFHIEAANLHGVHVCQECGLVMSLHRNSMCADCAEATGSCTIL